MEALLKTDKRWDRRVVYELTGKKFNKRGELMVDG
jgi:hypothetical protein